MPHVRKFASTSLGIFTPLFFSWSSLSVFANAQGGQGQDAVYNSIAGIVGSPSFIDASMFGFPGTNICAVLNGILNSSTVTYPPSGAVIDARGLPGTTGTSMKCALSPWNGITNPPPSTILLPATFAAKADGTIRPASKIAKASRKLLWVLWKAKVTKPQAGRGESR